MKKITRFFLILTALFLLAFPAFAAGENLSTAVPVNPETTYTFTIPQRSSYYLRLDVTTDCIMKISGETADYSKDVVVRVMDSNGEKYEGNRFTASGDPYHWGTKTFCRYSSFQTGTYYLSVWNNAMSPTTFSITTSVTQRSDTSTVIGSDSNHYRSEAKAFDIGNTLRGVSTEGCHYFVFKIPVDHCQIQLNISALTKLESPIGTPLYFYLDNMGNGVKENLPITYYDSPTSKTLELNKGTYYLYTRCLSSKSHAMEYCVKTKYIPSIAQKISVKVSSKTYTVSSLKKSAKTFSIKASAKGKLSYKVTKGSKYISVSKTGKVTVKKKTPAGTYQIRVTAAAKDYYKKTIKYITVKVKK